MSLRRRDFITLLGGAAAVWPLAARAQQASGMRRIGVLLATGQKDTDTPNRIAAMRQVLQSFGWNEGKNLWIDIRFGEGDIKLIHKHAMELVGSNPDAILVLGTVVVMALQQVTRSIPVVFVQVSDPVKAGFVSSLSHPGGNITGFTTYEYTMGGKWLEVLKDHQPKCYASPLSSQSRERCPMGGIYPRFRSIRTGEWGTNCFGCRTRPRRN